MDNMDIFTKLDCKESVSNVATLEENIHRVIKVEDFDKICRTCLTSNTEGKSICDVVLKNITITSLLEKFISMQKLQSDYLPQSLCNACISELVKFHQFEQKCVKNEQVLENIFESKEDYKLAKIELVENPIEHTSDTEIDEKPPKIGLLENQIKHVSDSEIDEKPPKTDSVSQKTRLANRKNFKCRDCDVICANWITLFQHRKDAKHPKIISEICKECGKMFKSNKIMLHMRSHTKEKPYVCKLCSKGFSLDCNLKRHMMTHTGEKPHVCEICGKGFIQLTSMETHKQTHFNTDPLNIICAYCGRRFKIMARYNAHLRKHLSSDSSVQKRIDDNEPREYACDKCKRAYKTKTSLKVHQMTHEERRFLCSDCGKRFVTNTGLQTHLKVHTGEKPYTCIVCKKSFAVIGSFNAHMLIHTGERPYSCNICKKSFTQLPHLKYHERTHSGERPYVCSFCGKRFGLKCHLTVHIRRHTGETPFNCPECGRGFYDSSGMKKHRRGHVQDNEQLSQNYSSVEVSEQKENNHNTSDDENCLLSDKQADVELDKNEEFNQII